MSSFCRRCKVYADIRGDSPNFYENFRRIYVYLYLIAYVDRSVYLYEILKITILIIGLYYDVSHSRLGGKGRAVPKSGVDCGN